MLRCAAEIPYNDVASSWHYHARARKQRTVQYDEATHCVADHPDVAIENMLHVHALLSSSMNRPATKYNSLPSKSQGAKIVVGRYGRNGKTMEQRLIDQERRAEAAAAARGRGSTYMLMSKLIHEIGWLHGCYMHYIYT